MTIFGAAHASVAARGSLAAPPPAGSPGQGDDRAPIGTPDDSVRALRAVHRSVGELRRGTPVMLLGSAERAGTGLLFLSAETGAAGAGARALRRLARPGGGDAVLVLSSTRAAALLARSPGDGDRPVALRLPPGMLGTDAGAVLARAAADPAAEPTVAAGARLERADAVPPLAGAALALAKLARLLPAVVALPVPVAAVATAEGAGLLAVAEADVLAYPATAVATLERVAEARVPLEDAPDARVVAFRPADGAVEHIAVLVGDPAGAAARGSPPTAGRAAPLARVHSECFTGDVLGSMRCDCGPQLRGAIGRMAAEGTGVLLYLAQEGRGIGLPSKLRAYALQDRGLDTLDANRALGYGADERDFLVAATMLRLLGVPRVRLLTNNPDKVAGLVASGVAVEGRVRHAFAANGVNDAYLATKASRFGHLLGPVLGGPATAEVG